MENFDYEKIYKLVENHYKNNKEKCLVCHCPIESKEIKLDCSHEYHFTCFDIKKNSKCFYCGKTNFKKVKKINELKEINILNNQNCTSLIKSGPKKGEICNRINCKYHIKNI